MSDAGRGTGARNGAAGRLAASEPPRPVRAMLGVPLFYKILIANSVIVVLGAVVGTAAARQLQRPDAGDLPAPIVVLLLALAGVAVTVLVNALILRLALTPVQILEATAARIQAGDVNARAPHSVLADRELERLTRTFNGMLDNLQEYRERLREVAARALTASEEERKRISRELHDDTAQTLAALLIRLRVARATGDDAARDALLEEFRVEVGDALERVRRFARGLRPPALDELGLVPALESHVRALSETAGATIRMHADAPAAPLSPQAELALYRIAQEALSNAVRHAGAREIDLRIETRGDELVLTVTDDGKGFDSAGIREGEGRGLGLFGMRERAAYVGGRVEIDSRPGTGTEVRAIVPLASDSMRAG